MPKKKKGKLYRQKYFEVFRRFGITPNFKFDDLEKDIVKKIDELASIEFFDFCDYFDLKPSNAKKVIATLVEKGAVNYSDSKLTLTPETIKYLHSTKEQRKSEKKFRKFVDCLDEQGLDEFMKLVDSFVIDPNAIKENSIEAMLLSGVRIEEPKPEPEPVKEEVKEEPVKEEPKPKAKPARKAKVAPKVEEEPKPEPEPVKEEEKPIEEGKPRPRRSAKPVKRKPMPIKEDSPLPASRKGKK
ncbi:MAG: hypothetical protein K6B65_03685 [Bacilli bacterium]|nr:hypothetical protein [Bacilli bacterium]